MTGLFGRLAAQSQNGPEPSRTERAGHKLDMIKRHLETLLNTRQGCSQSSPELGLRDFNSHDSSSGDLLQQISEDIRLTIHRFEPRIRLQALTAIPDANAPLELHFRLECQLQVNNLSEQLQIDLLVNGHNRYTRVR
ncbi:type VI secretion system baseplate subunit TssE [Pseudomonas sp. S31]|uniref:type VI secretion system baseplate subunit TssE n=1 Tax=Pseudomonas sp. S31 TaxID=1564473 RepID=UPI0019113251|nr:type VI secretion system baseplate subunit TssE [Pseudomonas sp. S31]MBK4998179.1 type VI secretion system baseplate subunit TssE [Pseudomonas sp. S31]